MPLKPVLTQDHIPACKFGDLECQGFRMLIDGQVQGTGMRKLIFGFPSVDHNNGSWFGLQREWQVVSKYTVQVDELR